MQNDLVAYQLDSKNAVMEGHGSGLQTFHFSWYLVYRRRHTPDSLKAKESLGHGFGAKESCVCKETTTKARTAFI